MPITAAKKRQIPLSEIRKKVNSTLVIDSRSLYNRLSSKTDEFISKNWHNVDVANLQSYSSLRLFKLFAANDSSFSSSLYTHLRMMVDQSRTTVYKANDSIYTEGQSYIDMLVQRFNYADNYANGFYVPNTIHDQIGKIARNLLTSDNASAALFVQVDSKSYEADAFKVIDCDRVHFTNNGEFLLVGARKKNIPFIYENTKKVFLDVANFLWQPLDPDAEQMVGNNPLRPALRNTFTKLEFLENLRKVLKNQAWPKVKVVLDEEAVLNLAPPEIRNDKKKLIEFFNDYLSDVETQLTNIAVDQNIVVYNTISEISFLESQVKFDPRPIAEILDSEAISALKAPPSAVGKGGSTRTGEGLAGAELVIFRRTIKALRNLIESLYSRAFTLSLRLGGYQGYVKHRLNEFSLRPPEEAAQFDSIRVETIKSSWILGSIGDDEKDRKIRQIHNLEGKPPTDAKVREDLMEKPGVIPDRQTEPGADSKKAKEDKRSQTRKTQKSTGGDKK